MHAPLADDSRTILRVPSLATAGSSDTPSLSADPQDKDPAPSNYSGNAPATPRHRTRFGHRGGSAGVWGTPPSSVRSNTGPPIYVNYRPEDMVTTEGWAAHAPYSYPSKQPQPQPPSSSNAWMHAQGLHGSTNVHTTTHQAMPPYSPIRIRSGRGARRLSNASAVRHTSSFESASTAASAVPPPRTFPVSNRGGKGRRTDFSSNSNFSTPTSMKSIADGSEALTMLAKMGEQHQLLQQQQQQQHHEQQQLLKSGDSTHVDETERRNVLKRKLPLSNSSSRTPTPAVDAASTGV